MAAGVVRCTMPDGETQIEGLAAAARCRSALAQPAEPTAPTLSIGATCVDQLLASEGEATVAEGLEGRIPVPMFVAVREAFERRAAIALPVSAARRSGSERAIQILRTVVLQT
ncbi:MAG: hypothetical protein SFX73_34605 [Kofleriaceae bacterium]|nr:hypothetical protein [Kofleriaceae bacterium]